MWLTATYFAEKMWSFHQADWERRARRGDFIVYDSPDPAGSNDRSKPKKRPILPDKPPAPYRD